MLGIREKALPDMGRPDAVRVQFPSAHVYNILCRHVRQRIQGGHDKIQVAPSHCRRFLQLNPALQRRMPASRGRKRPSNGKESNLVKTASRATAHNDLQEVGRKYKINVVNTPAMALAESMLASTVEARLSPVRRKQ